MSHPATPVQRRRVNRSVGKDAIPSHDLPPHSCVLTLLATSRDVRAALAKRMRVPVFSEEQLAILVALHALDPMSATKHTLSSRAGVGLRQLILVIDSLMACDFLEEDPEPSDYYQGCFRLTRKGREGTIVAAHLFLEGVTELTQDLTEAQFAALDNVCQQLTGRARELRV